MFWGEITFLLEYNPCQGACTLVYQFYYCFSGKKPDCGSAIIRTVMLSFDNTASRRTNTLQKLSSVFFTLQLVAVSIKQKGEGRKLNILSLYQLVPLRTTSV